MEGVEGDWNGLIFRRATEDMAEQIQQLVVSSYYPDEPLTVRMGYSEEYDRDIQKLWRPHLGDGLSLAVFDKETGRMVAVRVSRESHKDDPKLNLQSEDVNKILKLIELLDAQSDVYNKFQVDRCSSSLLATVHPDYRGRGIVTEIYRRSIKLCRALAYKVIKVVFSSPYSRKGAENAGFKQVAYVDYHNLRNAEGSKFIEGSQPGDVITQSVYVIED